MSGTQAWGFTDDRGEQLGAARVPRRVVAYVRAGAALYDLGVTPVAVYGSGHDGEVYDPAKAGVLEAVGVPYLGPGRDLDEGVLRELRPDVVVDVTYDGKGPYALDKALVERLGVPLVALSVGGGGLDLPAILDRFAALAAGLRVVGPEVVGPEAGGPGGADVVVVSPVVVGAEALGPEIVRPVTVSPGVGPGQGAALAEFEAAEAALREAAARTGLRVLALSGAGPEQVHLARPQAWPELAWLAGLGLRLLDPGPGPGANWLTAGWELAAGLRPDLVLFDDRDHATPPYALPGGVRLAPWNPEIPPSPAAYARFFRDLAEALAP
ncbi:MULTISPECIES: ABC transporter substrate-binding protein [unclassified Streptomyces]|uniref:ABC transporter substrate-binding protein n=1 Tax=unclassified Streptomyces TaxID=2593676 RepID=UPI0006AEF232|nr:MULTISPECIES: ABC transporter substrate-binding protein [unclassified Streptomyces]KOX36424.1 ABC transporter substrate-binding protein [Streptomyces sp. NRRL F-6491]KOX51305.1 ABC transporter substrate-binding protein [Streptomyces sp. NRRL F-6492]